MRITYSPDANVLTIQLREGKPSDSRDIAEGIIVLHLSAKGQPLEIEILMLPITPSLGRGEPEAG